MEHKLGFKMCKHTIAAMFIDKLKVKEPNSYPTAEARENFEEKLRTEIEEVAEEFVTLTAWWITTLEVILPCSRPKFR